MIDRVRNLLEEAGLRAYLTGDVPGNPTFPYFLVYDLSPVRERALSRAESARTWRFGVTVVDLSSQHILGDAERVEGLLEGSRALGRFSRIETAASGPTIRDPEVTTDGLETHMHPVHFTVTIPREVVA